jgi:predicted small integral membrane protein
MHALPWLAWFGGGATLFNAIPHLVSGLTGRPFQSPFANPPGEGLSSATVNVLWGFANLAAAYGLLAHVGDFDLRQPADALASGLGGLAISLFAARHFGRFHGGDLC